MEEAIKQFAEQFNYTPVIENADNLYNAKHVIVAGMGGSHLATGILKARLPGIELYVHRDYDLPPYDDEFLKESLLIASSYSGNTEEVVSFLDAGLAQGYHMAVVATGGELIEKAKEFNVPYIQIPETGIQPRSALGYSAIALATFLGDQEVLAELKMLADSLHVESYRVQGKEIAEALKGHVPVVYSSLSNLPVAYNWKIKMNETGKIPAFYNVFPELNHNEMTGFDVTESTKDLSQNMKFIFLKDRDDHERIQKRMEVAEKLFEERGYEVITLDLHGETVLEKIFSSLVIADWTALHLSQIYGTEAEQVPMIEQFKKMIT